MSKNDPLEHPIVTPTTKSDQHDRLLSAEEIIRNNYMTSKEWDQACALALELFEIGQREAEEKGLILVDTKYEFGKDEKGNIILVDEVRFPLVCTRCSFRFIHPIRVAIGFVGATRNAKLQEKNPK